VIASKNKQFRSKGSARGQIKNAKRFYGFNSNYIELKLRFNSNYIELKLRFNSNYIELKLRFNSNYHGLNSLLTRIQIYNKNILWNKIILAVKLLLGALTPNKKVDLDKF
jgi:hypothetical protein